MCLTSVDAVEVKTKGFGWKVVEVNKNGTFDSLRAFGQRFNRWLKAQGPIIYASNGTVYKAGFHIFTSRAAARDYASPGETVVKVKYRKVTDTGIHSTYGDFAACVIAQEMLVLRPTKRTRA